MKQNATLNHERTTSVPLSTIENYKFSAHELLTLTLSQRQLCDLELLLNEGFAPLNGFMNQKEYESVLRDMRLDDGSLWPMPVTLDIDDDIAQALMPGQEVALRDTEGLLLAILQVGDVWQPDKKQEALSVFGTVDEAHPAVAYLQNHTKNYYVGGKLIGISLPHHYDFTHLRHTPMQLREYFAKLGWTKVVGFQTRNPMHRAHQELTLRAAQQTGANILIHPVVGMTKPGDIDYYTRVRCYEHVLQAYPENTAMLSLLPLAMRMGGPREALWHALIRKNYGCTHFIIGRDHAGPGKDSQGKPFYDPYAAQALAAQYQKEMGVDIIPFQEMVYSHKKNAYFARSDFPKDDQPATISGTELREALRQCDDIPEWFSYPAVIDELRKAHPQKHKQGLTVFLTGLPSSGKSTLANALALKLRELTDRQVTLLDGDVIRTHLSKGLGFSRDDREQNITRVGFVAKEITRHGGIAICALVAPFAKPRHIVREMVSEVGGYVEVYVSTTVEVCESRDRKGLYKKAREGAIKQFTGVSDPYETPTHAEIEVDTSNIEPQDAIAYLVEQIKQLGYVQ